MADAGVVLLIDDHPREAGFLIEVLARAGFKVLVAEDGAHGVEIASGTDIDVILLDVMMPALDGFDTCDRLKASERARDVPILFMTALTDNLDRIKAFSRGAVDYVTKPCRPEEVLARVSAHATIRRLRKELAEARVEIAALRERLRS